MASNAADLRNWDEKQQNNRHPYKYATKKAKLVSHVESTRCKLHARSKAGILLKTKGERFYQAKLVSTGRSISREGEKKAKLNRPLMIDDCRVKIWRGRVSYSV
jgi:hypothetical protein